MPRTSTRPALAYSVTGSGPAVVLAHALGCHAGMWDDLAGVLSATHTVITYDARSHGASEVVTTPFTVEDLVADAVRVLGAAGAGSTAWVGVSMGGMVGQGLALAHPGRVRTLVLANTTARYGPEARALWTERARIARQDGMAALADMVMERYFSPRFRRERPDIVARFRGDLLEVDPHGYAACCEALSMLDYLGRLSQVTCPTLVVAGTSDVATPPAVSDEIVRAMPGARMSNLDAGHLGPVERPEEFARLVQDFLA